MSLKRLRCPAYPMCTAELAVHFPGGPGRNSWGTYPGHAIPTGSMSGEACPAGDIRVTWTGVIKSADKARITEAGADWVRRIVSEGARRPDSELDADVERSLRELMQTDGDTTGIPLGRPADQSRDNYFPGRPADAPEPGVGERPAGRPAMDLGGGFLGRAAVDNARDQLRTLTGMAIDQMGSAQDTLARMTALVDSVAALREVVAGNLRATQGLVAAAIGSGDDVPEPAQRMQALLAAAAQAATGDGVTMALRVKIEQTFSQVAGAIEAAKEYRSLP